MQNTCPEQSEKNRAKVAEIRERVRKEQEIAQIELAEIDDPQNHDGRCLNISYKAYRVVEDFEGDFSLSEKSIKRLIFTALAFDLSLDELVEKAMKDVATIECQGFDR